MQGRCDARAKRQTRVAPRSNLPTPWRCISRLAKICAMGALWDLQKLSEPHSRHSEGEDMREGCANMDGRRKGRRNGAI
eukprot:2168917-Pyramimonas_sp.AAC.1